MKPTINPAKPDSNVAISLSPDTSACVKIKDATNSKFNEKRLININEIVEKTITPKMP